MHTNRLCRSALALLAMAGSLSAISTTARATTVALATNNAWNSFDVSGDLSASGGLEWIDVTDGSALSFTVITSASALLTVVDGGFAGDRFTVYDNGSLLGQTSAAVNSYPSSLGTNFDAALASTNYSNATFLLGAGTHVLTGELFVSALDGAGTALNSTTGAVRLSAVPLPASALLLLSGTGLLGFQLRRRRI